MPDTLRLRQSHGCATRSRRRSVVDRAGEPDYKPALPAASRPGSAQVAQLVEHATENRSVGGSIPPLGTIQEKSKSFGSPRFARRLICIQFWGQKRIGGFTKNMVSMSFMKLKTIILVTIFLVLVGGVASWYFLNHQKPSTIADKEILFRVKVSNVGLQNSSLVQGKQPTDFVEVKLLGQLFDSPKQFAPISKQMANWNTPTNAAVADFSAFKADDDNWVLEDFVPEEEKDVRSLLDDKAARDQNRKIF